MGFPEGVPTWIPAGVPDGLARDYVTECWAIFMEKEDEIKAGTLRPESIPQRAVRALRATNGFEGRVEKRRDGAVVLDERGKPVKFGAGVRSRTARIDAPMDMVEVPMDRRIIAAQAESYDRTASIAELREAMRRDAGVRHDERVAGERFVADCLDGVDRGAGTAQSNSRTNRWRREIGVRRRAMAVLAGPRPVGDRTLAYDIKAPSKGHTNKAMQYRKRGEELAASGA